MQTLQEAAAGGWLPQSTLRINKVVSRIGVELLQKCSVFGTDQIWLLGRCYKYELNNQPPSQT
jgi:hypothetical protein